MKIFISILSLVNIYIGSRCFLNVINVLQTTKYSKVGTLVFAILFLCMGFLSLYFCFLKSNNKAALWIGIGPWLLGLFILNN